MTRAIDRLIVSGSVDRSKAADGRTPISWVLSRLDARELEDEAAETVELEREGARLVVQLNRPRADVADVELVSADGQLALFDAEAPPRLPPPAPTLPPLVPVPPPPFHRARKLSFTALSTFESCSYRYFAERVAGMRPREGAVPGETGVGATEIGSIVHAVLERLDLAAPAVPEIGDEHLSEEERARVRGFVEAYCTSDLARRVAGLDGVVQEQHFTFEHDGVLLHGYLDVYHRQDGRALVVDYKTNMLGELSPEEIVDEGYRLQRLVYALACLRAGADEVEVVYQFLERPDALVATVFARADTPTLEAELSEAIARIQAGDFRPTPSEFTCAGCPALDVVCAGPRLRTAPPPALQAVG
jgi:ATP-dependent exoDNAse (exonuclease V) beta subunit